MGHDETSDESRLVSWKRISRYLGVSERTARRWRDEESLPVYSGSDGAPSTVFAFKPELDDWSKNRPPKTPEPKTDAETPPGKTTGQTTAGKNAVGLGVARCGADRIYGVFLFYRE